MKSFKEFLKEEKTYRKSVHTFDFNLDTIKSKAEKFAKERNSKVANFSYNKKSETVEFDIISDNPMSVKFIHKKLVDVAHRLNRMER